MVTFELRNKSFAKKDKWPFLFVITEIITGESNYSKPITNIEIVKISKSKYNLTIERRTVAQYKKILEQYFGYVFANKGKGYYVKKMPLPYSINNQIDGVEYLDSNDFNHTSKQIQICNKAIINEKYVMYECPEYIYKSLKVGKKSIKLVPIRIISFNDKYYLFSYCNLFDDFFYVNLNKSDIKPTYESFSSHKKKKELYAYKDYFKEYWNIVTGRLGILNIIKIDEPEDYGGHAAFIYKSKSFYPETIVSLKDKYGDDEIYGYEYGPFPKYEAYSHGAEYDDVFLDIHVPDIDEE